jgi:hypothetical protein
MAGRSRIARSLDDIERFGRSVEDWHTRRSVADPNHQYATPLRIIRDEVTTSLARLRPEYERLADLDRGAAYRECRRLDAVYLFIWQLYDWYREKFDQRDTALRPVLLAADEVVHSCYATAFPNRSTRPSTEPLVFVEPTMAPEARRWHVPPEGIDPVPDSKSTRGILDERVEILSIPTIRLPLLTLNEPWMLVLLAHEVGHHVHQGLGELVWTGFGADVGSHAAQLAGHEAKGLWRSWAREIFADLFGVLACGPSLIWAVSELEWGMDAHTASSALGYPPPPIRWNLMSSALEKAGLCDRPSFVTEVLLAVDTLPDDAGAPLRNGLRAVPSIAGAILAPVSEPPGMPSFLDLASFSAKDHQSHGAVETWTQRLTTSSWPVRSGDRADARLCVAAAAAAWATLPPDASRDRREDLAGRIVSQLILCHEEGTRRAGSAEAGPGTTFADDLLAMSSEKLGGAL